LQPGGWYKLYPHLIFFVKYLFWSGALLLDCNEGRVLPSYKIFKLPGKNPPPKHVTPKIKLRKRRKRKIEQKVPGPDAGGVLYTCKKLLYSIF
jgi:hypothetical protein